MNNQVFVSELVVVDRWDAHERANELARPAEEWFGGSVQLVSLEVSLRRTDDALHYVMTGRFAANAKGAPSGRLERAASWLGLTR